MTQRKHIRPVRIAKIERPPLTAEEQNMIELFCAKYENDVNAVIDESGNTPLHYAVLFCRDNDYEVVQFFISRGADIHAKNRIGNTPLNFAKNRRLAEVVEYLESIGAQSGSESP